MRSILSTAAATAVLFSASVSAQSPAWVLAAQPDSDMPLTVLPIGDAPLSVPVPIGLSVSDGTFALDAGDIVTLPLPDGSAPEARVVSRQMTALGGVQLTLSLLDRPGSGAVLYRGPDSVLASVWTAAGEYRVEPDQSGQLAIFAAPAIRQHEMAQRGQWHSLADRSRAESDAPADAWLDVVFAYDDDYRSVTRHNVLDYFDIDIGVLNETFAASDVSLQARILDIDPLATGNSVSSADLLTSIINRTGEFAQIDARIAAIGGDIYSVRRRQNTVRDGATSCEFPSLDDPSADYQGRFNIGVCRYSSFVHNIGHNLGLMHGVSIDGADHPGGLPVRWARGYRNEVSSEDGVPFNSVMTGAAPLSYQFSDSAMRCAERDSFCGIPVGSEGEANAALSLRTYAIGPATQGRANLRMRTAILPTSRSVAGGEAATAFMTVLNPTGVIGTNCRIRHHEAEAGNSSFAFTETDPATNSVTGETNAAFDLPPASARSFVIAYTPDSSGHFVTPLASCDNLPINDVTVGLNTLRTAREFGGNGQLVALAATIGSTGYVSVPDGRRGVFSVATINLGSAANLTVQAVSLDPDLPATGEVCQTDAAGVCMATPSSSLVVDIGPGETPTFGVFVRTQYPTPFAPRRRFEFQMLSRGVVAASTSVAIRDEAGLRAPDVEGAVLGVTGLDRVSGTVASATTGYADRFEIVDAPQSGSIEFDAVTGAYAYTAPLEPGTDRFTWRAGNAAAWSETAQVDVTVSALPVPAVENFSDVDDAGFNFVYDLDRVSQGRISRFNLVTAPAGVTYTFDRVSGRIEAEWPDTPGAHVFTFEAENERGRSAQATVSIQAEAFTPCIDYDHSGTRIGRRIESFETNGANEPSVAEAELLVRHLCYATVDAGSNRVEGFNANSFQPDSTWIDIFVASAAGQTPYSIQVYRRVGNRTFVNAGDFCFSSIGRSLVQCSSRDAIAP